MSDTEVSVPKRGRKPRGPRVPKIKTTSKIRQNITQEPLISSVRRSLDFAAGIADIGVSLINPFEDEVRSMEEGRELGKDKETKFQIEVRNALQDLRERGQNCRRQIDNQERKLNGLEELQQKFRQLDQQVLTRDTATRRVENQMSELTRNLNTLSIRSYEIEEKTIENRDLIDENQEKITKIQEEHEKLSKTVEDNYHGLTRVIQRGSQAPRSQACLNQYSLPTFHGSRRDKPMRYLRSLLNYIKIMGIYNEEFKCILEQSLRGPAYDWWEHIESRIDTIEDFQSRFTHKYWGEAVQDRIRQELEFGYYKTDNNGSKSEYVLNLYNDVKMLDDSPSMKSIVNKLAKHFDRDVRQTIINRGVKNVDELIDLLDNLEQMGDLNCNLSNRTYENTSSRWNLSMNQNKTYEPRRTNISSHQATGLKTSTPMSTGGRGVASNWRDPRPYRENESNRNRGQTGIDPHRESTQINQVEISEEPGNGERLH